MVEKEKNGMENSSKRLPSEQEIDDKLSEIADFSGEYLEISRILRLYAKLIYNLRLEMSDLKSKILSFLKALQDEGIDTREHMKDLEPDVGGFYS
jgi:hypothetical protein